MRLTFDSSKLKLNRAKLHVKNLQADLDAFFGTEFYRFWIDQETEPGRSLVKFQIVEPMPEHVPLTIGDAVHNLRTALDYVISDIILEKLGERSRDSYFPVRKNQSELIRDVRSGIIQRADAAIASFIVDEIRPYEGGNDDIFALHTLDILDKHRLLIPALHVVALHGVDIEDDGGFRMSNNSLIIGGHGQMMIPVSTSSNLRITRQGTAEFKAVFEPGTLVGREIVPSLNSFCETVEATIESFVRHCAR